MELDFKAVKALSSPTRVRILNNILQKEATPTSLSNDLEKSKSTISSHLEELKSAGLVEKDEEEGRKRVVYTPTRKARAIVEGKERKVKFTLTSSIVSMVAGLGFVGSGGYEMFLSPPVQEQPDAMMLAQEAGDTAVAESHELVSLSPDILLFVGAGLLGISALGFMYGITMKKLSSGVEE